MTVQESNKLIAEFMGNHTIGSTNDLYDPQQHNFPVEHTCSVDDIMYSTSWDWLMPVVEKIEDTWDFSVHIEDFCCTIFTRSVEFSFESPESKIDATYKAVVELIQWYNEQEKS